MNLGKDLGHLTYSTLVHQTDDWDQLWKSVHTYLPAVKARIAPHDPFGVCLRTSAPSAAYTGVVFDIGHQSVGYEDIPASLKKLVAAGVPIVKLQEAASMHMPHVTQKTVDALQPFAKTIYLSQTCQQKDGKTTNHISAKFKVQSGKVSGKYVSSSEVGSWELT